MTLFLSLFREEDILIAMLRLLEYERATVDAEGSIGLAALVTGKLPELKGKRYGNTRKGKRTVFLRCKASLIVCPRLSTTFGWNTSRTKGPPVLKVFEGTSAVLFCSVLFLFLTSVKQYWMKAGAKLARNNTSVSVKPSPCHS